MSDSTLFTEVVVTELIETVDESVILETIEVTDLIETPAEQGPRGRDGKDGVDASSISEKPNNRLTKEPDGLYVFDDLAPDPLAYYIISKN